MGLTTIGMRLASLMSSLSRLSKILAIFILFIPYQPIDSTSPADPTFDNLSEASKSAVISLLNEAVDQTKTDPLNLIRLGLEKAKEDKERLALEDSTNIAKFLPKDSDESPLTNTGEHMQQQQMLIRNEHDQPSATLDSEKISSEPILSSATDGQRPMQLSNDYPVSGEKFRHTGDHDEVSPEAAMLSRGLPLLRVNIPPSAPLAPGAHYPCELALQSDYTGHEPSAQPLNDSMPSSPVNIWKSNGPNRGRMLIDTHEQAVEGSIFDSYPLHSGATDALESPPKYQHESFDLHTTDSESDSESDSSSHSELYHADHRGLHHEPNAFGAPEVHVNQDFPKRKKKRRKHGSRKVRGSHKFVDSYIDHSSPYGPQVVHVKSKKKIGPDGAITHEHVETKTSVRDDPNSFGHSSSSTSSSSYSFSSSSNGHRHYHHHSNNPYGRRHAFTSTIPGTHTMPIMPPMAPMLPMAPMTPMSLGSNMQLMGSYWMHPPTSTAFASSFISDPSGTAFASTFAGDADDHY